MAKKRKRIRPREKIHHQLLALLDDPSPKFGHCTWRLLLECGNQFVREILAQTLEIEANGGMMTRDGSRRRTPGGVFMQLARAQMTPEKWRRLNTAPLKLKLRDEAAASGTLPQPEAIAQAEAEPESATPPMPQAETEAEIGLPPEREPEAKPTPAPAPRRPASAARKKSPAKAKQKPSSKAARAARFQISAPDVPEHLPPHLVGQLLQLRSAATMLRERVQQLESEPFAGQAGLEMTRKLLAKTEGQIAALLDQHAPAPDSEVVR